MMNYRPDVRATLCGDDLVLLDLTADEYVCLADIMKDAGETAIDPERLPPDAQTVLRDCGLIVTQTSGAGQAKSPPLKATHDLRDHRMPEIALSDILHAWLALLELRLAGRDATVGRLQGSVMLSAPSGPAKSSRAAVEAAAARFARILAWMPVRNQCLHRSALLMIYLRRLGLSADWVFGVRTWPFRAHCWVQVEDVCLNDDHERLRPYAVIDAVRLDGARI